MSTSIQWTLGARALVCWLEDGRPDGEWFAAEAKMMQSLDEPPWKGWDSLDSPGDQFVPDEDAVTCPLPPEHTGSVAAYAVWEKRPRLPTEAEHAALIAREGAGTGWMMRLHGTPDATGHLAPLVDLFRCWVFRDDYESMLSDAALAASLACGWESYPIRPDGCPVAWPDVP